MVDGPLRAGGAGDMLDRGGEKAQRGKRAAEAAAAAHDDFPSLVSEPAALPGPEAIATRIAAWERELRARGGDAGLHHEIGRLWEIWQRSPRNAAIAYQNAYRHDRSHLPTLRDARRLFSSVGNWQMVAQLFEAEAESVTDDRRRASLLFGRGLLLEERLGRAEAAQELYRRALELDPACLPALLHLASQQAADPAAFASTQKQIAAVVEDGALRVLALATAASTYDDRLGAPDEAARLWAEAFDEGAGGPAIARRHASHLRRLGRDEELVAMLRAEAAAAGPEGAAAAYALARILLHLDREDEALDALREARLLAPRDRLVLRELARIYEERRAWAELADVLEASATAASDEGERIALHLALGALYDERLERRDAAIRSYRAILEKVPHHGAALAALGRLYHQARDWEGLLATFEAEAAPAVDPRLRCASLFKAAVLLEEKLGRADEAIRRHETILQLLPGYLPSVQALARLFATAGRWAELAAMLESAPDHLPTLRELARPGEEAGDWEAVVSSLEREAERTGDQRHVIGLLHRIAEVVEERIGDRDRAAQCWRRLLTLAPSYLPALRAMGRSCAQKGRWEELAAMHRREADATADKRAAAAILWRVGELYEQELLDENRALATWREVLRLDPFHFPALQRLARIHHARADWDALIGVLREEAAARKGNGERAAIFCRIAEIQEERLSRTEAACEAWREALRLQPDLVIALQALERIYESAHAHRELVGIYERRLQSGPPERRATTWRELAQLYLDRLGEPGRAALCAEEALVLEPDNLAALHLLERIRSLQGDRHRRAAIRSRMAALLRAPAARAAMLLAANADRERAEGRSSLEELQEATRLVPGDERAFEALEQALVRTGDAAALAAAVQRRVAGERDPAAKIALLHRLAELFSRDLRDARGAGNALAQVLAIDPADLPALVDRARLLEAAGDWTELHANLLAQAAVLRDPGLAGEALLHAADVAEHRLGDDAAAMGDLRAVLARDASHPSAQRRLEELVAAHAGVGGLLRLHEHRAITAGISTDVAASWLAVARLRHQELRDPGAALEAVERALAACPAHRDALDLQGEIHLEQGQWQAAANALATRARLGGDGAASVHHQLALLHAERLGDPGQAIHHLQAAIDLDPDRLDALRLLARLQLATRDHRGALDTLRQLAAVERGSAAAAAVQANLALVHEEGFGDLAAAAAATERLLELEPHRLEAWRHLAQLYERMRDLPWLVSTLERWAQHVNAIQAAALLSRAAVVYDVPLHQPAVAVERWQQAIALDDGCMVARRALADRGGEGAIRHHLWLLDAEPLRAASRQALLEHLLEQGEEDRAFQSAAVLHLVGSLGGEALRWYEERRTTLGQLRALPPSIRQALLPEIATGPLGELASVIGSQLGRIVPPRLDRWQIGRGDLLGPDDRLRAEFESILLGLGGEPADFELLGSKVSLALAVEGTSPISVVLGRDLVQRALPRERTFLLGRIAWQLAQQNAFLHQLPVAESAAILGAAVQLHEPEFEGLGPIDPAERKRIHRALPRRVRKGIERLARELAMQPAPWDGAGFVDGVRHAEDRVGLLLAVDTEMALALVLRDAAPAIDLADPGATKAALGASPRALALLRWATSDEHLALRRELGTAIGR